MLFLDVEQASCLPLTSCGQDVRSTYLCVFNLLNLRIFAPVSEVILINSWLR